MHELSDVACWCALESAGTMVSDTRIALFGEFL
jgi:hypothetical protein